jgi:hypothetical protein
VILIVTCLSKWIDKDNFQGFDVCVMQRPLALRERCSSYCLPEMCKCNVRRYGCRAIDHVRWASIVPQLRLFTETLEFPTRSGDPFIQRGAIRI